MEDIIVSVGCMVYNHEKYLRKCLDGFIMQKTSFKFEVIVHDDASTDRSPDIIREYASKYPNIIKPIMQTENQYSKGIKINKTYIFPRVRGKYYAVCEGDDYWCDKNKLQRQVDAMEQNPDCHLCIHRVHAVKENGENTELFFPPFELEEGTLSTKRYMEIIGKCYAFQASSFFRRTDDMKKYLDNPPEFAKAADVGDEPSLLYFGSMGSVIYLADDMSCYRMQSIGSWNESQKKNKKKQLAHLRAMVKMYNLFNEYSKNQYETELNPRRKLCCLLICELDMTQTNARILCKRENRNFLKKRNAKARLYIIFRAYAPWVADLYYRIKGKTK